MLRDIKQPWLLYAKGLLFVVLGVIAAAMLLAEHPSLRVAVLLGIVVWAFCRAYYFAFYVIEHYVDGEYRYAGLFDFAKYVLRGGKRLGQFAKKVEQENDDSDEREHHG